MCKAGWFLTGCFQCLRTFLLSDGNKLIIIFFKPMKQDFDELTCDTEDGVDLVLDIVFLLFSSHPKIGLYCE